MVLHGWKQIAQYLGCGIRTAQRWESQCGLPVTRPRNHPRSPVLAHSEALDSWAGGPPPVATDAWEARWEAMERDVEHLKRQVMLLAGAEARAELNSATPERDRGRSMSGREPSIAAKSPTFDA